MSYDPDALQRGTTIQKAIPIARATATNTPRTARIPCATALDEPLKGTPAIVCGAGPSLDAVEIHPDECAVIAVNNSAPALARRGIPMDALVVVESLDMSPHLATAAEHAQAVVFDLSSHPGAWEHGTRKLWFGAHSPEAIEFCVAAGVRPLEHGGAAVLAAVSLALDWGADPVILAGCDLSWKPGAAYAKGAGWDGLTVREEGGSLVFEGRDDRDELHRAHGVAPVPRERPPMLVPGAHGEVATSPDYYMQVEYLAKEAARWPSRTLINTSGGARIDGWQDRPMPRFAPRQDTLRATIEAATPTDTTQAVEAAREALRAAEDFATRVLTGEWPTAHPALRHWPAVAEAWTARDMLLMADEGIDGDMRIEAYYVAIAEACRRALAAMD